MLLGAFGEITGRLRTLITPQTIIERLIIGADKWPVMRLMRTLEQAQTTIWRKVMIGASIGLFGSISGAYMGQLLLQWAS
jgi:hypothetical protein